MQRLIAGRTLTIAKSCDRLLLSQRHLMVPSKICFNKSVDEYVESQLQKEPSKMPLRLQTAYAAIRKKFKREPDSIDPELRNAYKAAGQLYYDCANNYPYLVLCKNFGLEDYMSTWFKLTLIHVWMLLLRIHVSLDAEAYNRIRDGILSTLWLDVDKRLELLGVCFTYFL
uniref:Ubiquinol-cytochrome c chaperone domain-containing protein n=1 Tax=Panagrolaimus davidi TaxID=227884 RepID=A0A914PG42_9BILA